MDSAQIVRRLRQDTGLTVRGLASVAHVSPATISRIESGRTSPTVDTLARIVDAAGRRLEIDVTPGSNPPLTRKDRRSLAFHRLVAAKLLTDPAGVVAKARQNLRVMSKSDRDGHASRYLDQWRELLAGDPDALVALLLDHSQRARDLRQVTPFAGVLSPEERAVVYPVTAASA